MRKLAKVLSAFAVALCCASAVVAQEGTVRAGYTTRSGEDASSLLQKYEVIPDGDVSLGLDVTIGLSDGRYVSLFGDKIFDGDEYGRIEYGRAGGFVVGAFFDRHQNWISNTGATAFVHQGSGVYTVDDDLQLANQTAGNTLAWRDAATPVDLRYERKAMGFDFAVPFLDAYTVSGSYKDEQRDGTKPVTFALFRGTTAGTGRPDQRIFEIPGAVDDGTKDMRLGVEYARGPLFLSANAFVSEYENNVGSYVFDNPSRIAPIAQGPTVIQGSVMPDNEAFNVDFQAAYRLGRQHRLSATFGTGRMESSDPMLDYSLNDPVVFTTPTFPDPQLAAPYTAFAGQIDTTHYMLKAAGDVSRFGYEVSYRGYEVENKAGHYEFVDAARMDTLIEEGPWHNEPADFSYDKLRAGVDFDAFEWLRLGVEYDVVNWERPERRVTENTVTALRGIVEARYKSFLTARISYTDASQEEDALGEPADGEDALARQFDVSERDTKAYDAHVMVMPSDRLSFGASLTSSESEYPTAAQGYGVTASSYDTWGLDLSFAMTDNVSLFGVYVNEAFDWDQQSRYARGTPNPALDSWRTETRDETDTYQVGFNARVTKKLDFQLDYTLSDGVSQVACFAAPGGNAAGDCAFPTTPTPVVQPNYPDVTSKLSWFKARGSYAFTPHFGLGLEFWKYEYEGEDWATDVMDVYMGDVLNPANQLGLNNTVFLGAQVPDYDADIYRVYVDYTF